MGKFYNYPNVLMGNFSKISVTVLILKSSIWCVYTLMHHFTYFTAVSSDCYQCTLLKLGLNNALTLAIWSEISRTANFGAFRFYRDFESQFLQSHFTI